jgi:transitional endoplasmic reticulum ATPase
VSEWIELRVLESKARDANRPVVRIDPEVMERAGIMVGDVIEIVGRRRTAAKVWSGLPEDRGKGVVRMNSILRKNADASLNETVRVRRVEPKPAIFVKLAPVSMTIAVDANFLQYIKQRLREYVLVEGDMIQIYVLSQPLMFQAIQAKPSGAVLIITEETQIQILERPVSGVKVPHVTWEDIGDLEDAKQKVRELVELPLRHPELFRHLGIEPPKGVLLIGPPGVGKTLLAKAVANEANAYFVAINGPEIMSKYYGESEARLREIFEEAKKSAPAIIFIDEIDAIAPKREEVTGEVEKRVVAQLLTLMDGLHERGQVIVIGATNRPDALDPALRRPGRFDREIWINPPDARGRYEILLVHTRNMPLAPDADLRKLAEVTHGYTGADLAALAREAAMSALRRAIQSGLIDMNQPAIPPEVLEKIKVTMADFIGAMREIIPSALREIHVEVPQVRWDDVGGLEEAKQDLREAVEWPLKYPEKFKKFGLRPPRGILLFGPPGTGKTLLAKAVATESGANFIAIRGPEILSKWVGESEKAIREIFKKARMAAPCVVFFDEVDAIAPARGSRYGDSGVMDRIVNQLLAEMDGIKTLESVVVIAATNRPDILDPALLRPGRLDRLIYVPPPDYRARLEIFRVHARKLKLADNVNLEELARRTEGYTGADIAAVVREAAMLALRETVRERASSVKPVSMRYFEEALKRVPPSLTQEDMRRYESISRTLKRATVGL